MKEGTSWKLMFCAGYRVPPCKGLEQSELQNKVEGSSIDVKLLPKYLINFFESTKKCPIDIVFASEEGKQQNQVRNLVRSLCFDNLDTKSKTSKELAYRLANMSDDRSGIGLLIILVGQANRNTRIFIWRFPCRRTIQAEMSKERMTIKLLENAFSGEETSIKFKAAVFEGSPSNTSFWKGKVGDNQAKQRVAEASEYWIIKFLQAVPEFTDVRGTKVLAKALRKIINQTEPVEVKEALVSAAEVIKSQSDKNTSIKEFADNYLPEDIRPTFIGMAGGSAIADNIFKVDGDVLNKEFKFKSIILDDLFTVRGPLDTFDEVVKVKSTNVKDVVEVSLQGTITSQKIQAR